MVLAQFLRYYSSTFLEELRKMTKNFSQNILSLGGDLDPELPK
jgi:hypothetical protein